MKYSALKGVQDILPPDIALWQKIETAARDIFSRYGFQEVKLPIIESTDIFIRSIGETTDIVEKEMYTFTDKGGRSVTLRPEGTASMVRAYVEHSLHTLPSPQKYYYMGPMFRYERPQRGRFRQFYQIGVEAFGSADPSIDAELILMLTNFLRAAGIDQLTAEVNSIGCDECRPVYKEALKKFFEGKLADLCPDCQRRFTTNPLRILDCKVPQCVALRENAPVVTEFLCEACRQHFDTLISRLTALGVPFSLNPHLVRGLDYYTRTAFEVKSGELGAQNAVAAGGRYDKLVQEFGGPQTPAIGFAAGIERLVELLKMKQELVQPSPKVFIVSLGDEAEVESAKIAEKIREKGFWVEINYGKASLKSQLRKADRLGAEYALILGENELKAGKIAWKKLKTGEQGEVALGDVLTIVSGPQ